MIKFYINILFLALIINSLPNAIYSNEPFVVLNYNNNSVLSNNIDSNNKFIKDSAHSEIHLVEEGDSLSGIINKYYKNTGLNMRIVEISIIEMNKNAFVRNNPNYLFAGKKIKIPSINEMMNLVKKTKKTKSQNINKKSHIYFFGSF